MPIISVQNLKKKYEFYKKDAGLWGSVKSVFYRKKLYKTAVDGISFNIEEGEMVAFLGPNGAGKTTTLKMLSGILHATEGQIDVLGYNPYDRKTAFQKQFSIVMGSRKQLIPAISVMDNFLFFKSVYRMANNEFKENIEELIDVLNIRNLLDRRVKGLSLGEHMKCEIVAALMHRPKVLFLDEPSIGLDVVAQKNIRDFIKKYNKEHKTTIILTSHYMHDIEELCDRVIVINFGKIIYDGQLKELVAKHKVGDEMDTDSVMRLVFQKEQ